MSPEQIEELGSALTQCRKHGVVADLPVHLIGSDDEAEAVQTAAVEAYGGDPCGYSVQATTPLSQRLLGCPTPIFGPLLDTDVVESGTSFRLPRGVLGAGCALSFILARPYPTDGEEISRQTVSRAIASCRLVIEVLGRRVPGSVPLNTRTATADFALLVVHVQGPCVDHWWDLDLSGTQALARLNGVVLAQSGCADVLGDPLEAITWLARALAARGRELEAGDCVTTGTCTGLLQVLPGQTFQAEATGLGKVSVSFE
jgi:2-keto-4-pentenoate hydratase